MNEKTQNTAIVPITETTAELILQPTAELIEKSLPKILSALQTRPIEVWRVATGATDFRRTPR